MEVVSLLPYFDANVSADRASVFLELAEDMVREHCEFMTMIRENDWKLVHVLGSTEGQLFNLEIHPDETNNLWDCADHANVRQQLALKILDWRVRSSKRIQPYLAHEEIA